MGRIVVEQHVTADGFAAGPGGELDWVDGSITDSEPMVSRMLAEFEEASAILLGRVTYELFIGYWPTASADPLAAPINSFPRHVVSTTLSMAPWGAHEPATLEPGDACETADRLAAMYDGDVIVWGSLTLASALLDGGCVDQVRLRVAPVMIGAGLPLWSGRFEPRAAQLVENLRLETGQVLLTYDLR
ncbi:dihydrofolate reductase family protein [Demequina sp. NBRC 110056]|uniref:dihydrofolate reductase family protein n=1 Tax=Demequina sp. NBRC 110056 TaxID=1570345 RepID=UPI000A03BFFB|nr:dihydrofolate reductase family protein [Demequina sp. NBRC 110056]